MKKADISKLYEHMTLADRASLTFEALIIEDTDSANKICDSVPRYTYKAVDTGYTKPLHSIFEIIFMWTVVYWKTDCKMMAAMGAELAFKDNDEEKSKKSLEIYHHWHGQLIAHELLLPELEQLLGVSVESILKFADVNHTHDKNILHSDLESAHKQHYDFHLELYKSLTTGDSLSPECNQYFQLGENSNPVVH